MVGRACSKKALHVRFGGPCPLRRTTWLSHGFGFGPFAAYIVVVMRLAHTWFRLDGTLAQHRSGTLVAGVPAKAQCFSLGGSQLKVSPRGLGSLSFAAKPVPGKAVASIRGRSKSLRLAVANTAAEGAEDQQHDEAEQRVKTDEWAGRGWIISGLAAIGVLDTSYLTAVKLGQAPLACPTDADSCAQVLSSPYASVGPVPLATFGAVAYTVVLLFGLKDDWPQSPALWWLCFGMAVASAALMALLIGVLKTPCIFCALSALVSSALLAIIETARSNTQSTGGSQPRVIIGLFSAAVAGGAVRAATLPPKPRASQNFNALTQLYKPDHPPVRSESSAAEVALAKHLSAIGAACYTAWWCPHCQDQREQFGREAVAQAPFVQCSDLTRKRNADCKEVSISGFPSWVIRGQVKEGSQSLADLAEFSGFTEYPKEAFAPRSKDITDYIWK